MPGSPQSGPQSGPSMSVSDIYANARGLSSYLKEKSQEIDEARRLPPEVVKRMREAGVFRISMPKEWGGPELNIMEINEIIEELATSNASAAWCAMIGCDSGFFSAFLDDSVARELYPQLDMVTAGSITPARADRVEGGYRIGGQWPFGSGITHADVVMAACLVFENGKPVRRGEVPELRLMLAPAASFEVIDTWHTTGMRGTGSNDFRASDLFISEERTFTFDTPAKRSGALYGDRFSFIAKFVGVALGMARAMIDQVAEVMQTKSEAPSNRPYKSLTRIQIAIAESEMILGAARSYAYFALERYWKRLVTSERVTQRERIELALSRVNSALGARTIIRSLYDAVGSSAIYSERGPFDRALRDVETLCQHLGVQRRILETVGAILLKADAVPLPYL